VNWLTAQLVEHEMDEKKWWESPFGFNYLAEPGEFPVPSGPPVGYERLPMEGSTDE